MAQQDEHTSSTELTALNSERKRLAESLYARGLITEEGLEKVRSDPEVIVGEGENP